MEFLERHFETAFDAPDGIDKLRELVLNLAIQGKLLPQNPQDMPASNLLQEIAVQKKRLIEEEGLKTKASEVITQDEEYVGRPFGWEYCRLGNLAKFIDYRGKTPKKVDAGIPLITAKNVRYGFINREPYEYITEDEYGKWMTRGFPKSGDLLFTTEAPLGNIAVIDIQEQFALAQRVICLQLHNPEIAVFLKWLMMSVTFQNQLLENATGMTAKGIKSALLKEIPIPLPPLPEQRRIVAKIDQLMARCDELEKLRTERNQKRLMVHTAALNRLLTAQASDSFTDAWRFIAQHFSELYSVKENVAELRKAILQLAVMGKLVEQDIKAQSIEKMLTKIQSERDAFKARKNASKVQSLQPLGYEIPKNWRWQCLENILIFGPTNGFSPKAVKYKTPVRSLTLSATTSGTFKGEYSKFIANEIPADSDLWLEDGDILVQRGNTLEYVGVPAVYRGEPNTYIYPDLMMKLRVSSEMDVNFVHLAMSSESCREFLRARASGTSGTMPKINQKTLKSLPIPIPPLSEQHRIVSKVDKLMRLCDTLEQYIENSTCQQTALLNAVMAQI